MKKYLAKGLGIALALSTVMAVPTQAAGFGVKDINGDGHVDTTDAIITLKGALNDPKKTTVDIEEEDPVEGGKKTTTYTLCDIDDDGVVTARDAALYMEQGVVLNIKAVRKSTGKLEEINIGALRDDKVLDLYNAKLDGGDYDEQINKYFDKAANRLKKVKVTVNVDGVNVDADICNEDAHKKVYNFMNTVSGFEGIIDEAKFEAAMPHAMSEITPDYAKGLHKKLLDCITDKSKEKAYAEALADKIENSASVKGNGKATLIYENSDGDTVVSSKPKYILADFVRTLGYEDVTVGDVMNHYGRSATLDYNDYTVTLTVKSGIDKK